MRFEVTTLEVQDWIDRLYKDPSMAEMGHGQTVADSNLGLGWIYYALGRALKPQIAVVIGSYRGFVPLVLGKALLDNGFGEVHFIDPSLVDDFWKERKSVRDHFCAHGVPNIIHHLATTEEFVETEAYKALGSVGILFVDGYHSEEHARFDHEAFLPKMHAETVTLFHDSVRERLTRMYGDDQAYVHTVCHYMDLLREDSRFEVATFPMADGLTLVKRAPL